MLKILITGGAGFIGSHVTDQLLERGDQVICLDNFNDYYSPVQKEHNLAAAQRHPNFGLYRADLRDYEGLQTVFEKTRPDKILHLAGMANIRYSVQHPLLYEAVNVRGTMHIFELARHAGIRQVVMASSSSIYGGCKEIPFSEEARVDKPMSPYAATKLAGELLAYTYHSLYGMKYTGLRFFTVYGPRNRPDMAVYLFTRAIDRGEPLKLFGDGSARRDWTFVGDTVRGIIAALDHPFDYEIINLGNSHTQSEMDLIHAAENALGKPAIINHVERPATELPITYADISKARRLLDFAPVTSFEEGYALFFEWYQSAGRE